MPQNGSPGEAQQSSIAPARRVPARLRDVAEAAGIDVSIASRVLNDDPRVSVRPATRKRILDAAARLDYRPNTAARSLKTARTMAIGLLVPDLFNVAYAAIARGAEERATSAGYTLLIATGHLSDRVRLLEGRVDGLMIATATADSAISVEAGNRMPILLINRREPGVVPSVTVRDEVGTSLATDYLVSLGHRRIGHIAGPQNTDTARRRLSGYLSSMETAELEPLVADSSYSEAGGYSAAMRLLNLSQPPTALLAVNLTSAMGAMAGVRRLDLRIPDDVSIVGFDDVELAAYLDPPLTTVRMPLEEMGAQAVGRILALVGGEQVDDLVVDIPPELVIRGSSGPPQAKELTASDR